MKSKHINKNSIWYNTARWRKLRASKFSYATLCEECLRLYDRVTMATEIHHIIPIDPNKPNVDLIYNFDNLMSLCSDCHHNIHKKLNKTKKKELSYVSKRRQPNKSGQLINNPTCGGDNIL